MLQRQLSPTYGVSKFPNTFERTNRNSEASLDMEKVWQFPCSSAAVDGCHISFKCPAGCLQANKECHNYENSYSIILMSMVDAKHRFPGNSYDSIILQSTKLWSKVTTGQTVPDIGKDIEGIRVPPLFWANLLMKPHTSAVLTPQKIF